MAHGARVVAQAHVFLVPNLPGLTIQAGFGEDAEEAVRILVDVRGEHHAIDDGEHAGIDADADGEGEDHHERQQRIAADDAAAVAYVFPDGGQEDGGVAAILGDLLFPGLGEEAAGGGEGGEHLRGRLRGGGEAGVLFDAAQVQLLDIDFGRFFPEQGVLFPLGEANGAPAAPEQGEAGKESEEAGEPARGGEQQRGNGGEVDRRHGPAEEHHPEPLFAGEVGTGEGELAPIAEEAFEAEEGDARAEGCDGEAAEPSEDGNGCRQAGQIHGSDAADDDEALDGGQPGCAAFLVGGLEHPVGLEGDG